MLRKLVCFVFVAALSAQAFAGVAVNVTSYSSQSAITSWPLAYTDTITASGNPAPYSQAENNYGGSSLYSLAQSWTSTASGKLTDVQIAITGTAPVSFNLNLYDGGTSGWADQGGTAYNPGVNVSNNLFSSSLAVTWTGYTLEGASAAVLDFVLSDADQVSIMAGHQYILEIASATNPNGMIWFRNGATGVNYTGGQAFRQRSPLNGNPARDMTLAVTVIPEPATLALLALGGLALLRRKHA